MENILKQDDKIKEEVALKLMQQFVEKWTYEKEDFSKIEEQYPQALKALQKGILIFNDDFIPTYNLAFPISLESEETSISNVTFRTRIKPFDLSRITKGIDVSKNQVKFTLKCLSYLSGLSEGELNSIEKFDYKVIEQVSTAFF